MPSPQLDASRGSPAVPKSPNASEWREILEAGTEEAVLVGDIKRKSDELATRLGMTMRALKFERDFYALKIKRLKAICEAVLFTPDSVATEPSGVQALAEQILLILEKHGQ